MAWFDSILKGTSNPSYYKNVTTSTSLAAAQAMQGIQQGMGQGYANAQQQYQGQTQLSLASSATVYLVKNYAAAIGWSCTHHYIPDGVTSDDPKIAMLKLTVIGEVLKDVGVRTSTADFYVMRSPDV